MSKRKKKKHGSKQKKILKYQSLVSNVESIKPELLEGTKPEESVNRKIAVVNQESNTNDSPPPSIVDSKYDYVKKEISRISKLMIVLLIFEIGLWFLLRFTTLEEYLYRLVKL